MVARTTRTAPASRYRNDTTLESDYMPNPLLPQTRSEMAVPMVAGGQVLGVLDVQDNQPNRFAQTEQDTFGTLTG